MAITKEEMFEQFLEMQEAHQCFFKLVRYLNRAKIDASESTIEIIESAEAKVNEAEARIANELTRLSSEYKLKYIKK